MSAPTCIRSTVSTRWPSTSTCESRTRLFASAPMSAQAAAKSSAKVANGGGDQLESGGHTADGGAASSQGQPSWIALVAAEPLVLDNAGVVELTPDGKQVRVAVVAAEGDDDLL